MMRGRDKANRPRGTKLARKLPDERSVGLARVACCARSAPRGAHVPVGGVAAGIACAHTYARTDALGRTRA